jgi:hypothetical protein
MALFFSALVLALAILLSTRFSFEPLYIPPVRGEGFLQGLKTGEEKGVWVLDGWTGQVRFCRFQDKEQAVECSPWQGGRFQVPFSSPPRQATIMTGVRPSQP